MAYWGKEAECPNRLRGWEKGPCRGENRRHDPRFTKALLYHLSYAGVKNHYRLHSHSCQRVVSGIRRAGSSRILRTFLAQ